MKFSNLLTWAVIISVLTLGVIGLRSLSDESKRSLEEESYYADGVENYWWR
jgi:hypothetical protein